MEDLIDEENFMMILRPAADVAARCIVLACVCGHAEDTFLKFDDWLQREGLWSQATPTESSFLLNPDPSRKEIRNLSWRQESFLTLMWALGHVQELPPPLQTIQFAQLLALIPAPDEPVNTFREGSTLRSIEEILPVYQDTYEKHWAIRDALTNGRNAPAGVEAGVIYERHYALNWLRRYGIFEEQEWDDITTDT